MNAATRINGSVFILEGTYTCSELKVPAGIGMKGLEYSVLKDNVLYNGILKQLLVV